MKVKNLEYARGDWIVHLYHGVGQIVGIEKKYLEGEIVSYFKVKTRDSTFWVPVKQVDNVRIRRIASRKDIQEVLNILKRKPRAMSDDHAQRKSRISSVKEDGTLAAMARMVRDLTARQKQTRLNDSEERALNWFTERLLSEWATCFGIRLEEARKRLSQILQKL